MSDAQTLVELIEADRWYERVRAQRDHLPERSDLQVVENELRGLVEERSALDATLTPLRSAYAAAARQSGELRDRAAALARALDSSTSNARDLVALQNELASVRSTLSDAEDHEVALMVDIDPLESDLEEIRERARPLVERRKDLQSSLGALEASLDEELAELATKRQRVAEQVRGELLRRYEAAKKRAGVSGAALLDGDRCDGCRVTLSPLERDRCRSLPDGQFMECPSCGRLLVAC